MAKKTTFTLAANIIGDATSGILVGDFNNWDESNGIALKQKDGTLTADVALEPGTYHYRYFLNNGKWVNDGNADQYAPVHGLHVDNCVITVVKSEEAAPKKVAAPKVETPVTEEPKAVAKPKKVTAPKAEAASVEAKSKPEPKPKVEPKAKAPAKTAAPKAKK